MTQADEHLNAVYAAKSAEDIARHYDDWASGYEGDMALAGYRHPSIATALCARYLPAGAAPVLDAGAGTGLLGEWLRLIGYPKIEALDISDGMLAVARSKGVYDVLHQCALGGPLPFEDARFAGVVCAGVLTTGHVGAEALPELTRVTAKAGILVLTIKEPLWAAEVSGQLAGLGLTLLESTEPYLSMPNEPSATPSRAVALQRI
ncbi:MAG: class I SAM-dependent methyltransferase [Pseudomonadota bacterium]